jgi:hypothetical protein
MDSYVYFVSIALGLGGAIWLYMSRSSAGHKTTPSSAFLATKPTNIKVPVKGPVKKVAEKKAVRTSRKVVNIRLSHFKFA